MLLALVPKCGLCVLGYLGLGAALGLGGPEICGAIGGPSAPWRMWLPVAGLALGATWALLRARGGRRPVSR